MDLRKLAIAFYDIGSVKFGDFTTKDNVYTPVYFDLRKMISHPKLMNEACKCLWSLAGDLKTSQICGVPYTALPLATLISIEADIPMLLRRKEPKPYGMKKLIEGQHEIGQNCVLIEDVVTSGSSIMETARDLEKEGLQVTHAFVILDRDQGAVENLRNEGITLKSLFTMSTFLTYLFEAGKISAKNLKDATEYARSSTVPLPSVVLRPQINRLKMKYSERAQTTENSVATRLFKLMDLKKTTLCLAADLTSVNEILNLADLAGPHIAVLKLHVDIIDNFDFNFVQELKKLATRHNFLLMEDRQFSDTERIVAIQYAKGLYKIIEWADLVTVHCVAGPETLSGLQLSLNQMNGERGIFLVTELSLDGALTTGNYVKQSLTIADNYRRIITGHMCQSNIFNYPGFIHLTPQVNLSTSTDALGRSCSPEAVVNSGGDLVIVGKDIIEVSDPLDSVLRYKEQLWSAYEKRVS